MRLFWWNLSLDWKGSRNYRKLVFGLLAAVIAAVCFLVGCQQVTESSGRLWSTFVEDLIDLNRLPCLGTRGVTLISSFDRSGGNNDFNYFLRKGSEDGWVVLADLKGPACVRRFWLTGIEYGHPFKMYFNGERKPRISGTVDDLFGGRAPFLPPLAQHINQCWWSYVPLTFSKSLRIETKAPPIHPYWGPRRLFYQINVEFFKNDFALQTIPLKMTESDRSVLHKASRRWNESLQWPVWSKGDAQSINLASRQSAIILDANGPGTVESWHIDVGKKIGEQWTQRSEEFLLQDILLEVFYDGLSQPSISVPLGDFFCNGWRRRYFGSLLLGSASSGYWSALPMPFKRHITMKVTNLSDATVSVHYHFQILPRRNEDDGYLHAEWHKSGPLAGRPHTIAQLTGEGKFVGCFLCVTAFQKSWWILEGDDIIYVDGKLDPFWHGTGLEDYFNGGFYYRGVSFSPVHGIMDRYPFRVAQYRFHITDPIVFSRSFLMQFERGDQNVSKGIMRSVAYLYLKIPHGGMTCPLERGVRRAEENPFEEYSLMLQLFELERMNNFENAMHLVKEWLERFPGHVDRGVLRLRVLEYRRLLGEQISRSEYLPFISGKYGEKAAAEAKLLTWFYEKPNRALVGLCVNGKGRIFLDGRCLLKGDAPLDLGVVGVELAKGRHILAAQVNYVRPAAWIQLGIRMQNGVKGTGPGTLATREATPNWQTVADISGDSWANTVSMAVMRGPPHDENYVGARPNAFVLLQSKVYGIRAPDWDYLKGIGYFRLTFDSPITNMPIFCRYVTGLFK